MHCARLLIAAASLAAAASCSRSGPTTADGCDASIKVPEGFCATLVTDAAGRARHIAVRSNGDIFVARLGSRRDSGGVSVIRGSTVETFWATPVHGLVLASDSTLYASTAHEILRFRFKGDSLRPRKVVDTIVGGLPGTIPSNSLVLDERGNLIVGIPALRASCDARTPCPDLATSGGIWRFDTGKRHQTLSDGSRIATGLRAPLALAINPRDTMVYAVTHGPDSLHERHPAIDAVVAATHPGDEMVRVASIRADYGFPYCYYDVIAGLRVQSPEYGGDGRAAGNCDRLIRPVMSFPAHWEPMAMVFASGDKLPAKYRDGAFVAFHGSAHRAPLPEDGYLVAFVPFNAGIASMEFEIFADGFAGAMKSPAGARSRPAGIALGADGSLYVSDDKGGRIWKITWKGK